MDYEIGVTNAGPSLPSLATQLLTIAIVVLRRTLHHRAIHTRRPIEDCYDYIVVGSGTSGSLIAGRLSEDRDRTVLVLEAGGPQTVTSDSPSYARQESNSYMDWAFRTVPQYPYAGNAFIDNGRVPISRGKIVGGSHNINFMVYSRGSRHDFDKWASPPYNADGWSYKDVLPYFLKTENNTDRRLVELYPDYHSNSGSVVIQTPRMPDPITEIIKQSLVADYGVPLTDQNGPSQVGIANFQQTIYLNGTRSTTASVFLEANMNRTNLQVLTRAFVTRILFDGTPGRDLRAVGVEYTFDGHNFRVYASREVIMCAGSINSPQLLMLSGIGPKDHLTELGIEPLVDLPVGKNLQDHVYVQLDFEILEKNLITSSIEWNVKNMYENFGLDSGPLTQYPLVYLYTNSLYNNQSDYPDIQINFQVVPVSDNLDELVKPYNPAYRDQWRKYYGPHVGHKNRLGVLCFLYRPRSIGELRLENTDPKTHPVLDMRYLTEPYDVKALTDAIRLAFIMTSQSPIISGLIRPWKHPIPGCHLCPTGPIYECHRYLECYARALTSTVGHQVGTIRMASRSNPTAVVDPKLKVIGVKNLRVADGSILPTITNGNTNAPCMMIGERAAEFIRREHR